MTDQPLQYKGGSEGRKHHGLYEPVRKPVQVREIISVLVDRKKIQIILAFFQFDIVSHEPEDGIFPGSLYLIVCRPVRFQQFLDKIYGQADKEEPGFSDIFFYVKYILVDEAAGAGRVQVVLVFQALCNAPLQDDHQLKKGVLVQGAGIEFVKIRDNVGGIKIVLVRRDGHHVIIIFVGKAAAVGPGELDRVRHIIIRIDRAVYVMDL